MSINPGILSTVEWLQSNGFKTCDSGDGITHDYECDQECPYVHIQVAKSKLVSESDRLAKLLSRLGIQLKPMDEENTVPSIQASYSLPDGFAFITLWNVTINRTNANS